MNKLLKYKLIIFILQLFLIKIEKFMNHRNLETDVLIAGGGASGVCAAIQAARLGAKVVLVEETPWLGGMLTAAGVSAVDGNHQMPSGIWGEFRQRLNDYYGGAESVKTGWVSNTLFEPHVGNLIFQNMIQQEPNITVIYGFWVVEALKSKNSVEGAVFQNEQGEKLKVQAQISIDATELGDLMALAGCDYNVGRDARDETGEPAAPESGDNFIQDLTCVAILKDYGTAADKTIPCPPGYHAENYRGTCKEAGGGDDAMDCQTMLDYGRLPNDKFMINWPNFGNDFYLNLIEKNRDERIQLLQAARNFTLGYVYFLQTELELKNLGLADDEFPTVDQLPFIPYHRESRRLKGMVRLTTNHLEKPYDFELFKSGIAVGDYPLDHHHKRAPKLIEEPFPQIPAFNVPYGCLVPQKIDGLLVAEKSISVTHLVNGCTRLQPVVMQIGQAAGAAAVLCVKNQAQPRQVKIRELQQQLLDAKCWLMPFCDLTADDPTFQSVQRVGLCCILKGELISHGWENEMRFHPDDFVTDEDINIAKNRVAKFESEFSIDQKLDNLLSSNLAKKMTRKEFAIFIDQEFDPFNRLPVD